jgi:hypothetical protein
VADVVCIRVVWDRAAIPLALRGFHTVHVGPEPDWPFGRRGAAMAGAWRQLGGRADGMLVLDGDVAADPLDKVAMFAAIEEDHRVVHVAPVRLWPASTHRHSWVWGHGRGDFSQEDTDDPDLFTFSFTYLPLRLIETCIRAGMAGWHYPHVAERMRVESQRMGMVVRVVRAAAPKHMNY